MSVRRLVLLTDPSRPPSLTMWHTMIRADENKKERKKGKHIQIGSSCRRRQCGAKPLAGSILCGVLVWRTYRGGLGASSLHGNGVTDLPACDLGLVCDVTRRYCLGEGDLVSTRCKDSLEFGFARRILSCRAWGLLTYTSIVLVLMILCTVTPKVSLAPRPLLMLWHTMIRADESKKTMLLSLG